MVRNSPKFVSWKDYKAVTIDLTVTKEEALKALQAFSARWDDKCPFLRQIPYTGRNKNVGNTVHHPLIFYILYL
jgi:transposase-like protein